MILNPLDTTIVRLSVQIRNQEVALASAQQERDALKAENEQMKCRIEELEKNQTCNTVARTELTLGGDPE